jgi:CDGSH-type Zn-finger protein
MPAKITIKHNGSIRVEGDFQIFDAEGKEYGLKGREAVSLCRCGLSNNKPFCDGRHKDQFDHLSKAFDLPEKPA